MEVAVVVLFQFPREKTIFFQVNINILIYIFTIISPYSEYISRNSLYDTSDRRLSIYKVRVALTEYSSISKSAYFERFTKSCSSFSK